VRISFNGGFLMTFKNVCRKYVTFMHMKKIRGKILRGRHYDFGDSNVGYGQKRMRNTALTYTGYANAGTPILM